MQNNITYVQYGNIHFNGNEMYIWQFITLRAENDSRRFNKLANDVHSFAKPKFICKTTQKFE